MVNMNAVACFSSLIFSSVETIPTSQSLYGMELNNALSVSVLAGSRWHKRVIEKNLTKVAMVGRLMTHKDTYILNPGTNESVTLHTNRNFAGLRLKTLR